MPHVRLFEYAAEVWTGEGHILMEIGRYTSPDGHTYWLADDTIFPKYALAAAHMTTLGLAPLDSRSDFG